MLFAATAPGVVTLFAGAAATPPGVDCLMCPFEPLCYDTLCEFMPQCAKAAEIGSFKGGSACILANGMRKRGKELTLCCHDLFGPFEAQGAVHDIEACFDANLARFGVAAIKVKGDSGATHAVHEDRSLDYCFIDGDHSYEGALADIRNFRPKLRPGGWLVVQDCIGDVRRAVQHALATELMLLVEPPLGHYVVVCNSDAGKLKAFGDAFRAKCAGLTSDIKRIEI